MGAPLSGRLYLDATDETDEWSSSGCARRRLRLCSIIGGRLEQP
jgi:hypothetical protein